MLILLSILLMPGQKPVEKEVGYLPPQTYLVRAKMVDKARHSNDIHDKALLRVTKVVAGPKRLFDQEFDCLVGSRFIYASGFGPGCEWPLDGVVEHLDKDVEGLWWVYEDPDFQILKPELRYTEVERYRLHSFPLLHTKKALNGFNDFDPRLAGVERGKYEEVLQELRRKDAAAWEEAAAAIYNAKTEEQRRALLEKHAATADSLLSGWAISLLARNPREATTRFLRELSANDKIHADAQITLDCALCRIDSKDWPKSEPRLKLLRRWLDPKASDTLFAFGCQRVRESYLARETSLSHFTSIFSIAIDSADKLTKEQNRVLAEQLGAIRFPAAERNDGFRFLINVFEKGKTNWVRATAVRALRGFRPFTDDETKAIRTLRDKEQNKDVAAWLDGVLAPLAKQK